MKKIYKGLVVSALCLSSVGCASDSEATRMGYTEIGNEKYPGSHLIELNETTAKLDGQEVEVFDYTWHCDPYEVHDEVKDAPAEYYTGEKPETYAAAYIDQQLYYYPELPAEEFKRVRYDGEMEWAFYYPVSEYEEYIFATLPSLGSSVPEDMMHSEEEAAENKVLHITQPGTYVLQGTWKGQVKVDLGEDVFTDENAKITVVLNGVDITCSVAPGIVFENVYECDNTWEDREEYSEQVDTSNPGVTVVLADDSENTVTGTNVFRMLKTKYKDEDSTDAVKLQKKMRKIDGTFYSYVTMNIEGEENNTGKLTVNAGFEGIDSELHMNINGGNIVINSQDDGINVNEDNVSVVSVNGGNLEINAALGAEGDGIDSNGYIIINGGTVSVNGIRVPDSALDSEDGVYYNGGTIIIDGETQEYEVGDVFGETGGMHGGPGMGFMGNQEIDVKELKEKVAALDDDATFEDLMALVSPQGMGPMGDMGRPGDRPEKPEGEMGRPGNRREDGMSGATAEGKGEKPKDDMSSDTAKDKDEDAMSGATSEEYEDDWFEDEWYDDEWYGDDWDEWLDDDWFEDEMSGATPEGRDPMGNQEIDIKAIKEKVAALSDDASWEEVMEALGLSFGGPMGEGKPL